MAEQLQAKGGAGYIQQDEGRFRVLLVAYEDKADATNVSQRLQTNQQLETKIYELHRDVINIELEGQEKEISLIENAFHLTDSAVAEVFSLSLAFDKGDMTETEVREKCSKIFQEIEEIKKSVDEKRNIDDNNIVSFLTKCLDEYCTSLQDVESAEDALVVSSQLKKTYFQMQFAQIEMAKSTSNT